MNMQRSTAKQLCNALQKALSDNPDDVILLPDSVKALMNDALARDELQKAIDENVDQQ